MVQISPHITIGHIEIHMHLQIHKQKLTAQINNKKSIKSFLKNSKKTIK